MDWRCSAFGRKPWSGGSGKRPASDWSVKYATLAPGIGALAPARPANTVPNGSATTTAELVFATAALSALTWARLISPTAVAAVAVHLRPEGQMRIT